MTNLWPFQLANQAVLAGALIGFIIFLLILTVLVRIAMKAIPGFTESGIKHINKNARLIELVSKVLPVFFFAILLLLVINIFANGEIALF